MNLKRLVRPNKEFVTVLELLSPLAVYLAATSGAEWYWWLTAFVFYFLYMVIGNHIAMHRYFCHGQFEVSRLTECLFVWTSAMSAMGSPISWPVMHMHHHKHSDGPLDVHGPTVGFKTVLYYFYRNVEIDPAVFKSPRYKYLVERYWWVNKYYWYLVLANVGVLALLGWKVFLFVWFLPVTLTVSVIAISIYMQHWPKGSATNDRYYSLIGLGESLHLNHHLKPGVSNTAFNPGEFDYMHWVAKLFATRFNNESDTH